MRHLVIYDRSDPPKQIGNHPWVQRSTVTSPGVLVLDLGDTPGAAATRLAYAPGYWGKVIERLGDDEPTEAAQSAADTVVTGTYPVVPAVPVTPGPITDAELDRVLGPVGWEAPLATELGISDRDRLSIAMTIHCTCAQLRCPVVLNPGSDAERHWWQRRQHGGTHTLKAPMPVPRHQCSFMIGHNVHEQAHEWVEGGWPFGPAEHHPACPRHPDNYNRPGSVAMPGEGQATTPGITPADAPTDVPGEPDLPQTTPLDDRPDPPLGRPYVNPASPAFASYDRNPVLLVGPDEEPFLPEVRRTMRVCAVPGPDEHPFPVWCNENPRHIENHHTMTRPGGERIMWLRRGTPAHH